MAAVPRNGFQCGAEEVEGTVNGAIICIFERFLEFGEAQASAVDVPGANAIARVRGLFLAGMEALTGLAGNGHEGDALGVNFRHLACGPGRGGN